jgi:hypothetical protein
MDVWVEDRAAKIGVSFFLGAFEEERVATRLASAVPIGLYYTVPAVLRP